MCAKPSALFSALAVVACAAFVNLRAQGQSDPAGPVSPDAPQAAAAPASPNAPPGGVGAGAFPARPPGDRASVERGKKAYKTNCAYCHGDDARGGDNGGTNILRSEYIMRDKNGETLRQFLLNRGETRHVGVREGILKFGFSSGQASDIAAFVTDISAFVHDFRVSSRDAGRMRPATIVVGDAKAGETYFNASCASCHSATGDLQGIATKISDPRTLQQTWLMPKVRVYTGRGPAALQGVTVTVTQPDGTRFEGQLDRLDDFIVTLTQADGTPLSFDRDHDKPAVEIHDPMRPHKELLPVYSDKAIHDVTAYLVTLK
jgi:cytochrome c oxidase cbb3-type subunit 3